MFASAVLLISYTLWSQSIIAEVYTPATALLTLVLFLLLRWSDQPLERRRLLFAAAFLSSLGLGVHLFSLMLLGPAAVVFVLWTVFSSPNARKRWRVLLGLAAAGAVGGVLLFFLLFLCIDSRPTPTSFYAVSLYPSRDAFGLDEADFSNRLGRFWWSVTGLQWRDRMLSPDVNYGEQADEFFNTLLPREFAPPALLLAGLGLLITWLRRRRQVTLLALTLLPAFFSALFYDPGDKFIFYLPTYILLAVFMAIALDRLVGWLERIVPLRRIAQPCLVALLLVLCIQPVASARWQAMQTGNAAFVEERYPYPDDLTEPRRVAACVIDAVEPNALILADWRQLWAIYYLAQVKNQAPDLILYEPRPYGTVEVTDSLLADIRAALDAGRPVYTDNRDRRLRSSFTLRPFAVVCPGYALSALSARS